MMSIRGRKFPAFRASITKTGCALLRRSDDSARSRQGLELWKSVSSTITKLMEKREKITLGLCGLFTAVSGLLHFMGANPVLIFVVTAGALALLALMVGDA